MKKLLTYLLAAALVIALLCPAAALAAGEEIPLWQEWGWDSLEELLETFEITEEEYYILEAEERESQAKWEGYEEVPLWGEWGYDSLEELLEDLGITEEEYNEIVDELLSYYNGDYYNDYYDDYYDEWYEAYIQEIKEQRQEDLIEFGGTPGIINVMYNGKCLKLSDAPPEITDGTTCVPAEILFDAMGAKMSFNEQMRRLTVDFNSGTIMQLFIGENTMSVTQDGKTRELTISAAPYSRDGYTFAPVRDIIEALDMSIYWDSTVRTVVIIDADSIVAEVNKDFTIINKLFNMKFGWLSREDDVFETTAALLAAITQFNSLDGDSLINIGVDFTILSDGRNISFKGAADLSELMDMLLEIYKYEGYFYDDDEIQMATQMFDAIADASVELILNCDEDILYMKSPLFQQLQPIFPETPDIPENAWIAIDGILEDIDFTEFYNAIGDVSVGSLIGGKSVGEVIYSNNDYYWDYYYGYTGGDIFGDSSRFYLYSDVMYDTNELKTVFADDKFKQNGDDYVLSLSHDEAVELFGYDGEYSYYDLVEFDLQLTVNTSGGDVTGLSGSFVYRERPSSYYGYYSYYSYSSVGSLLDSLSGYGGYGYSDTRYSIEFDITPEHQYIKFGIHEKNNMAAEIEADIKTAPTDEPVPAGPPEGDIVIPFEDLVSTTTTTYPPID